MNSAYTDNNDSKGNSNYVVYFILIKCFTHDYIFLYGIFHLTSERHLHVPINSDVFFFSPNISAITCYLYLFLFCFKMNEIRTAYLLKLWK